MIQLKQLINEASDFTAKSKESGKLVHFKSKDSYDKAIKAGSHEDPNKDTSKGDDSKSGVNIFNTTTKSEPKKDEPKKVKFKDFQSDVESSLKGNGFSSADLGGLDGVEDFEDSDGNYVSISKGKVFGDDNKFSVMGGKVDDRDDADADTNYQSFNSKEDAIAYAKELAGKLKGGKEEPKKDEPKAEPKPQRKGNPQVNKAVRNKASSLGITPAKLGKEEYQMKMAQAAIEALTDSNYHSEARALIAALEGKPEWAEKPTDMPDMSSPKYDEWRKNSVYSSEYYDADNATQELGTTASQESGWDGQDAIDGIAFELRMNGFGKLADKIQSVIKEGKRTSLKNLMK